MTETLAVCVFNQNQREQTSTLITSLQSINHPEPIIYVFDIGCLPHQQTPKGEDQNWNIQEYYQLTEDEGMAVAGQIITRLIDQGRMAYWWFLDGGVGVNPVKIDEWLKFLETHSRYAAVMSQSGPGNCLVRSEAFKPTGWFDDRYRDEFAALDWAYRLKEKGWLVKRDSKERLLINQSRRSVLYPYFLGRNPGLFCRLRLKGKGSIGNYLIVTGWWLQGLGTTLGEFNLRHLKLFWQGTRDGFKLFCFG